MAKKETSKKTVTPKTKTVTKKGTTKTATKKTTKKVANPLSPISGKAVGRNVILIIGGEKITKVLKEKADRDFILEEVEKYNKKMTRKQEAVILEFMLKDFTTEEQRKEEIKSKAVVKEVEKPKVEKATKITIAQAKQMLEKDGYTVSKAVPQQRRRSGEY